MAASSRRAGKMRTSPRGAVTLLRARRRISSWSIARGRPHEPGRAAPRGPGSRRERAGARSQHWTAPRTTALGCCTGSRPHGAARTKECGADRARPSSGERPLMTKRSSVLALASARFSAPRRSAPPPPPLRSPTRANLKVVLDPYTLNETTANAHLGHVYEGLTKRGKDLSIEPGLARAGDPRRRQALALRAARGR